MNVFFIKIQTNFRGFGLKKLYVIVQVIKYFEPFEEC